MGCYTTFKGFPTKLMAVPTKVMGCPTKVMGEAIISPLDQLTIYKPIS